MEIVCTGCGKKGGEVTSLARLILTVHCPFCELDFELGVDATEPVDVPAVATRNEPPAST